MTLLTFQNQIMPELSDFTEDNTGIYGITDIHQ